MRRTVFCLIILLFGVESAWAELVLYRKRGKAYVEAPKRGWKGRKISVWSDGRYLGKFKIVRYLENRDILVLRDREGLIASRAEVSFRKPRSRRRPASFRSARRRVRGSKWSYGIFGGTGLSGPVGSGYIDNMTPGISVGGMVLYKLAPNWDLQVSAQYVTTTGTGSSSDQATVTRLLDTWTADFSYDMSGSIETIKIPVTINYNFGRSWVFRAGGYLDIIHAADYTADLVLERVEGSILSVTFNEEQKIGGDLTENLNTTIFGLTAGVSYVYKNWRLNIDGGYSFGDAFAEGIVVDQVKIGEVLGFEITEENFQLDKADSRSAFAQLTLSFLF